MKEKNPWTTLNKKPIYDNPWISLSEHDVLNPSGNEGIYGVVHFKNIAVAIVPIDAEGYTWLVGQYRYTLESYSWEVPEGGCPVHESPLESAKRELQEETGLRAQKWTEIMTLHTSNSVTDELGYAYIAQDLAQGEAQPEETEQLQVKRLPLKEAINWCMEGKITDALSLATLFKTQLMLDRGLLKL